MLVLCTSSFLRQRMFSRVRKLFLIDFYKNCLKLLSKCVHVLVLSILYVLLLVSSQIKYVLMILM